MELVQVFKQLAGTGFTGIVILLLGLGGMAFAYLVFARTRKVGFPNPRADVEAVFKGLAHLLWRK